MRSIMKQAATMVVIALLFTGCAETNKTTINSDKGVSSVTSEKSDVATSNIDTTGNMGRDEGHLYFSGGIDSLYKKSIKNSEKEKISEDKMLSAKVADDWIYYTNLSDEGKLYKMRKDGTQKTKLSEDAPYGMIVTGGWIYYVNYFNDLNMYKIQIDGTEKTKLNNDKCGMNFIVSDGWIYYTAAVSDALDSEYKLHKIRIDGTDRKILIDKNATPLIIYDGWLYCNIPKDTDYKLYRMSLDGTDNMGLSPDSTASITVINGWIYYTANVFENQKLNVKLYKMRPDGSERQAVE